MLDADSEIDMAVKRARALAWSGDDEAAKAAFVEALRLDPTHFEALNDFGASGDAASQLCYWTFPQRRPILPC